MSNFVGTPQLLNPLWVAMETIHFLMAQTGQFIFWTTLFCICGVLINKLAPIKVVQGYKVSYVGPLTICPGTL